MLTSTRAIHFLETLEIPQGAKSGSLAPFQQQFVKGALVDNVDGGRLDDCRDMRGFMVEIAREIASRDGIERMLVVQMAATHVAFVRSSQRMANAEHLSQVEANERAMTKTARTAASPSATSRVT